MTKYSSTFWSLLLLSASITSIALAEKNTPIPSDGLSKNLLFNSDYEQWAEHRGAVVSSTFGVGYMLANINAKVWNVSDVGVEKVFEVPHETISRHFTSYLEKYKSAQISTTNFLFTNAPNSSVMLPEEAKSLDTQLIYTDYINDWNASWHLMNGLVSNSTGGTLDKQLIPRSRFLGAAFNRDTVGGYVSTTHYKGKWQNTFKSVGERNFSDGAILPFYQVDGEHYLLQETNYTGVAFKLADTTKYAVFVLPKGDFNAFFQSDLQDLLETKTNLRQWILYKKSRSIQIPRIKIDVLRQHLRDLKMLGINNTFCLPTSQPGPDAGIEEAGGKENYIALRPFFAGPSVQAGHLEITEEFFEVSTGTAMTVNSLAKLVEDDNGDDKKGRHGATSAAEGYKLLGGVKSLVGRFAEPSQQKRKKWIKKSSEAATATPEKDIIAFNRPFFWYLYDEGVGPMYYGSVNAMAQYEEEMLAGEMEGLADLAQVFLWNCP